MQEIAKDGEVIFPLNLKMCLNVTSSPLVISIKNQLTILWVKQDL